MLQRFTNLRLRQVDQALHEWRGIGATGRPKGGWIRSIRQALGMSSSQLAEKMGLSRQAVAELERREANRTATLAILDRAAEALDAELVYAIVPRKTLRKALESRAREKAKQHLDRVAHSMRLEAQEVSKDEYESQLAEATEKWLQSPGRDLWSEK